MYDAAKNWTIIILILLLIIIGIVISNTKHTQKKLIGDIIESTISDKLAPYFNEHSRMLCIEGDWYIIYYTNYGTSNEVRLLPTNKSCEAG